MNIAIINKNPVIAQLIEMALKGKKHNAVNMDLATLADGIFDLIIIDDMIYDDKILLKFPNSKVIVMTHLEMADKFKENKGIWKILNKPFMPTAISTVLDEADALLSLEKQTKIKIPKATLVKTETVKQATEEKTNITPPTATSVENKKDSFQIIKRTTTSPKKDASEKPIVENTIITELPKTTSVDAKTDLHQSIKETQILLKQDVAQKQQTKNKNYLTKHIFEKNQRTNSNKIFDSLLSMKPKKLKKLLKGATISIEIKFPKDKQ